MLIFPGELEVRRRSGGGRVVRGRFPYKKRAVLSNGGERGKPIKEEFAPGAFAFRISNPKEDIHLLFGHDYDKPLASRLTRTLSLTDTVEALVFEAVITDKVQQTSYANDVLALIGAGLAVGLSPGFRVPPKRTVPDAETITQENPSEGRAIIRTINHALLYELSVVTSPAYSETEVEEAGEEAEHRYNIVNTLSPTYRWRHV
jgi:HK97 family phage prohead protease